MSAASDPSRMYLSWANRWGPVRPPHTLFTRAAVRHDGAPSHARSSRDQRLRDDRKARRGRGRPAGRHAPRRRREDEAELRGEARAEQGLLPLRLEQGGPREVRESRGEGAGRLGRPLEGLGSRRRLHAGGERLQVDIRESGREGDLAGRGGALPDEPVLQRGRELRRLSWSGLRAGAVVQHDGPNPNATRSTRTSGSRRSSRSWSAARRTPGT